MGAVILSLRMNFIHIIIILMVKEIIKDSHSKKKEIHKKRSRNSGKKVSGRPKRSH
jgi:hypothetical protein